MRTVLIDEPGTFKFEALDGDGLGFIDAITVDSGVVGLVDVYVARDDAAGGGPGAIDVKLLDLSGTTQSRLMELNITGNLAEDGDVVLNTIAGHVDVAGAVLHDVRIGVLDGDFECTAMEDFTADGPSIPTPWVHTGNLTVHGPYDGSIFVRGSTSYDLLAGMIVIEGDMSGRIEVTGDMHYVVVGVDGQGGDLTGEIVAGGDARYIDVYGGVSATGSVEIGDELEGCGQINIYGGDLAGLVSVFKHARGWINAYHSIASTGRVEVGDDLYGVVWANDDQAGDIVVGRVLRGYVITTEGEMPGTLTVGESGGRVIISESGHEAFTGTYTIFGDMTRHLCTYDMHGEVVIGGDMTGMIAIDGDLADPVGDLSGGHIIINGSLGTYAEIIITGAIAVNEGGPFIAIDHDGWDEEDSWGLYSTVTVDETDYHGNTPALHIWEISACKGDMNNDWETNNFDISPFTNALLDHSPGSDYDYDFPGLLGSIVYHGDMDCDGTFNNFDIRPFIMRLTNPAGYAADYPGCDPCLELGKAGGGREGGEDADPEAVAELFRDYVERERLPFVISVAEELAEYYRDTPPGVFWRAVAAELR